MGGKIGFSTSKYLKEQRKKIISRVNKFHRLYLEIGGKLSYDFHASRVLLGYKPTSKIRLLKSLKDYEIIYCINARDICSGRIIRDFNLPYEKHALKDLKNLSKFRIRVNNIAITRFENQKKALEFKKLLEKLGYNVCMHREISGYPYNLNKVIKGFEKEPYIEISKNLIVITGPASNSGKMGLALSQIYHERKEGIEAGFAKLETFPIWNLPLDHPINLAYEAATADLGDKIMLDKYHKRAYGINAVNYNRDIENFAILRKIIAGITKEREAFGYKSPTDMGINMAKSGIIDDKICRKASIEEIKRRCEEYQKEGNKRAVSRMKQIIKKI